MVTYSSNELVSSSDVAKKFGHYLSSIAKHSSDKIAILKNNKVEAVLVSKDNYEKMYEALKKAEAQEILGSINNGLNDIKQGKTYPIDTLWSKLDS
jgi:PHD/YefM family antitoxin component YafN of YafNO toxin-antitoxin module